MNISILICTYNRADELLLSLKSHEALVAPSAIQWEIGGGEAGDLPIFVVLGHEQPQAERIDVGELKKGEPGEREEGEAGGGEAGGAASMGGSTQPLTGGETGGAEGGAPGRVGRPRTPIMGRCPCAGSAPEVDSDPRSKVGVTGATSVGAMLHGAAISGSSSSGSF